MWNQLTTYHLVLHWNDHFPKATWHRVHTRCPEQQAVPALVLFMQLHHCLHTQSDCWRVGPYHKERRYLLNQSLVILSWTTQLHMNSAEHLRGMVTQSYWPVIASQVISNKWWKSHSETAVVSLPSFVWDDWAGDHWFSVNGTKWPSPDYSALFWCSSLVWGKTTSDYSKYMSSEISPMHLSFIHFNSILCIEAMDTVLVTTKVISYKNALAWTLSTAYAKHLCPFITNYRQIELQHKQWFNNSDIKALIFWLKDMDAEDCIC